MTYYWRRQVGNQPIYASQGSAALVGDGRRQVRKTFRQEVPKGQYDVRIKRVTSDSTDDRTTLETQLLGVKFFQRQDADTGGQLRASMLVQATGQLNGAIDRYSAYASASAPAPELNFVSIKTSNPAAWFYLIAKGIYHPTSGRLLAGGGLPDAKIDLDALKAWADFCNANALTFNGEFKGKISVAEALNKVARVGRGSLSYQGGKLSVVWDAPNLSPVAMFGPHNMIPGTFSVSYISDKMADEIVVRFENEAKNYESDTIRVTVPGATTVGQDPAEVDLFGVTNEAQAAKEANLLAAAQLWRRRKISWETDLEGLIVSRGDVVLLSHDLTLWGATGRVFAAASTTSITLDKPVTGNGTTQWLAFRRPDHADITYHQVQAFTGESSTLTLLTALPVVPGADGNHVPADYVWAFDATATPGKKVKITSLVPVDENRVKLEAVDEYAEYYLSEVNPYTYQPSAPIIGTLPSITQLRISTYNDPSGADGQLYAQATWVVFGANFTEAAVYVKAGANGVFEYKGSTKQSSFVFPVDPMVTYEVKVVVYGALGTIGGSNYMTVAWQASSGPPPAVTGLVSETGSTVTSGQDMRIAWNDTPLTTHYSILITAGAFSKTVTSVEPRFTYSAEDARLDGGPWRSITFAVRAVNLEGQSATAASITLTNPAPAALTGLSLQSSLDIAILNFTPPPDPDYVGVMVWASTTSGFTPGPANLVYEGRDTSVVIRLANPALTYYVRAAAYDTFGKDALNLSSELSVTGSMIEHADLATAVADLLDTLEMQQTVKLANGVIAGYGLASTPPDADEQTSAFIVQADRFAIVKPDTGASTITAISRTSNVVTATVSAAHNLSVGTSITVSGVANAGFNGTFVVTSLPSATQVQWSQTAANASSSGGTLRAVPLIPFIFDTTVNPPVLSIDGYLSADRIRAGTFQAVTNVGSTRVLIDGPSERITVNDGTRDRVKMGKLGTGNYGLEVIDAAGNVVLSNDGRLGSTLYIGGGSTTLGEFAANAAAPTMQMIGEFATAPSPASYPENSVYRNSTDGNTYVLHSGVWELFLQKGADGEDGAPGTAKLLALSATTQVFQVSKAGVGSPTSVTLTAAQQNLAGSPTFTVTAGTVTGGLTGGPGPTRSFTYANMATDLVTVEVSWDGLTDTISIVKVREGADGTPAIVAMLTNEVQALAANDTGVVASYALATSFMKVYNGATDDTANWTFAAGTKSPAGLAVTVTDVAGADKGKVAVTGGLTDDTGYVDVVATRSGYATLTKRFTVTKSKSGVPGTDGSDAKIVSLSASSQIFQINKLGANSPASITFTAVGQNLTGSPAFSVTAGATLTGTGNTRELTFANMGALEVAVVTVTWDGQTDTVTVAKVREGTDGTDGTDGTNGTDGLNAISAVLSNEAHVFPASTSGAVSSYTGSGTEIRVYEGASELTYDGVGTANGTWKVTATPTNITVGTLTDSGTYLTVGVHSGVASGTDVSTIVYTITGKTAAGAAFTITKNQTFSKSKTGATGSSATAYWLLASAPAVQKSVAGAYTPSVVTYSTISKTGTSSPAAYAGRFIIATSPDGVTYTNQYTSAANESSTNYTVPAGIKTIRVRAYLAGGTTTLIDELITTIVSDGANGTDGTDGADGADGLPAITPVLSNASHTVPASTAGVVSSYTGSGTTIQIYEGATLLQYNTTLANGVFTIGTPVVSPASSITVGARSGSGTTTATVDVHASMTQDVVTITYPITVRRATGQDVTFNLVQTITKSKTGATGTTGSQGPRGSVTVYLSGYTTWDAATETDVNSYFTTNYGGKVLNDVVTVYGTGFSQTRFWNNSAWVQVTVAIDGNLLVSGTVGASAISVTSLAAVSATLGNVSAGSIRGGAYSAYSWPAAGAGGGFYLGPEGLLLGSANDGKYLQVTAEGNIYAPGLSIVNGSLTASGNITANNLVANTVYTDDIVSNAVSKMQSASGGGGSLSTAYSYLCSTTFAHNGVPFFLTGTVSFSTTAPSVPVEVQLYRSDGAVLKTAYGTVKEYQNLTITLTYATGYHGGTYTHYVRARTLDVVTCSFLDSTLLALETRR